MELFELGKCLITPGAKRELDEGEFPAECLLIRHRQGDWGDLDSDDLDANEEALHTGDRIFSVYIIEGTKFWVITEADRSSTTIMLPSEY